MRAKRIAAIVMSVFMVLSLLPSAVFAAAVSTLEGQVKINGNATPGTTLSADLNGVKPEGISEDSVSYVAPFDDPYFCSHNFVIDSI